MLVTETFHGYIETTQDVLLIFEGCRRGLLPRICRRLQERERKMIRSGSIFVFDERESGIKRWTDGRVWSPSRILGNFLIYRELDKKSNNDNETKMSISSTSSSSSTSIYGGIDASPSSTVKRSFSIDSSASVDKSKERQLVGSLSDSYRFKQDGLIKKTMSIIVNGVAQHLISYYDPNEVLQEKLRAPSSVPELASLEISPELLAKQNFRIPPLVEPTFDPMTLPPDNNNNRSMSVGSIHGQQELIQHMYSSNNNNTPSSSPSTPILSFPTRQQSFNQQQHQRHYSTSSISSNSLPRFDPRNYNNANTTTTAATAATATERFASPNLGQLLNPIHPLNNDVFGMSSHHQQQQQQHYDYNASSSLRNSISNQHEEPPTPTATTENSEIPDYMHYYQQQQQRQSYDEQQQLSFMNHAAIGQQDTADIEHLMLK